VNAHQCRPELGQNCKFSARAVGALRPLSISKQCAAKMFNCFDVGSPMGGLFSCCAPINSGLFRVLGGVAMLGEQLRLVFSNLSELAFECLNDSGVKRASRLAQQCFVCRALDQRMLELVGRMRRHALPKEQTSRNEAIECQSQ